MNLIATDTATNKPNDANSLKGACGANGLDVIGLCFMAESPATDVKSFINDGLKDAEINACSFYERFWVVKK